MGRLCKRDDGFTLIEIMIVVLIIGILLAAAVPNLQKARKHSRTKACVANMRRIHGAMEQFALESNKTTGVMIAATDLVPSYLRVMPTCPSGGTYTGIHRVDHVPNCTIHGDPDSPHDEK